MISNPSRFVLALKEGRLKGEILQILHVLNSISFLGYSSCGLMVPLQIGRFLDLALIISG